MITLLKYFSLTERKTSHSCYRRLILVIGVDLKWLAVA